jgi:hypothetical protein
MNSPERGWQVLANLFAVAVRLVPRKMRYPFALRLARTITRFAGPRLMKRPHRYLWSTVVEETIRAILRAMARRGIAFEPRVRLEVESDLVETVRARGAILVGAHFPLNALVTRYLHDRGCHSIVLAGILGEDYYIWGTSVRQDAVTPRQTILVTLRERLRERRAVVMVLDRAEEEDRTKLIETVMGPIPVATPIFEFAKKLGIPLYWTCARAYASGDAVVWIKSIETFEDYAVELRRHAQEVAAMRASA